jgi:hypothetical protein
MESQPRHEPDSCPSFWRQLLHRWLIEHNPLYLASATLVLAGMILTSRGLALEGSVYGELAVAAIAEAYAAALIGGAALLTRIGQRRPAVMLGLLTVLYQGDLTLHTEACVNLGAAGLVGTAVWSALFVVKLYALAWALRLQVSRAAAATATLGALGLSTLPYVLQSTDARAAGAIVSVWWFALASMHGHRTHADVTSAVPLDPWGWTVLRRAVRASWLLWAAILGLHVLFWSTLRPLHLGALVTAVPFLFLRRLRTEARIWALAVGALLLVGLALPSAFATCALLASVSLALRARGATLDRDARARLACGAVFALYISVWTHGWTGGPWPPHDEALDATMLVIVLAVAARARSRFAFAPLAIVGAHLVVELKLIPAPHSLVGWGAATLTLGFALLLVALATSYRFAPEITAAGRERRRRTSSFQGALHQGPRSWD